MNALNANGAAGARQVTCETADNHWIPVDLDVLRLSHTFKKMYEDLGLGEHDVFQGVFPVRTVSTRVFKKVIDWCEEHKDDPEPVVEKDPLTQECMWLAFTESQRRFFNVWVLELLEVLMAANYLNIPHLYHYSCQAIAARIKGKRPREICEMLQQHCDLDRAEIRKALDDNPWLQWTGAFSGAHIEVNHEKFSAILALHGNPLSLLRRELYNAIFIPNEVLLAIFEKLPREDLERLQLVSTQFDDVIASSSELSAQQGPLRVVDKLEFSAYSYGHFPQKISITLRDGTRVTCTDCKDLAKRLKFAIVQKLRLGRAYQADTQSLTRLLPVKCAWKNATVEASVVCFSSVAVFEFAFTQLLLCKKIILDREDSWMLWSRPYMRLPAIVACNTLDMGRLNLRWDIIQPTDVVEWLEHEVPPENKWSETRRLVLKERAISSLHGGINGLLTALKTAFSSSRSPKPYAVRILRWYHFGNLNEVLENETTHEVLSIRIGQSNEVLVERS